MPHPRQQQHDARPGIDPGRPDAIPSPVVDQTPSTPATSHDAPWTVSPREANPSGPAFADPPAHPGGPDQRPTPTTTSVTSAVGGSSNGATTDSEEEEEDQTHVAAAKGEGDANAAAGRSLPASARATDAAGSNGSAEPAALENLPSVAARQSIPNSPAMDAIRPSPAAARPTPCTSAASDNDRRKETTFCERLLSCFGLCS